jgi:ParB/RepB/Spo0J family partition protein
MNKENAMAEDEIHVCNQLYSIPLADLEPDPDQPRKHFDPAALEELTASIARNNVMTPIFFRIDDGRKVIVAGERRCAAADGNTEKVKGIFSDMSATAKKITELDIKTLTKEGKRKFTVSLQNMKTVVENALAATAA